MKKLFYWIAALPALALLGGVGVLAYGISQTWTQADTQTLILAIANACMGGALVIGLVLAVLIGVPVAIRMYGESGRARQQWQDFSPQRGSSIIEGEWQRLPTQSNPHALAIPPWQVTGGGRLDLIQDDLHSQSPNKDRLPWAGARDEED